MPTSRVVRVASRAGEVRMSAGRRPGAARRGPRFGSLGRGPQWWPGRCRALRFVARFRRPRSTAQGVLVEAAAGHFATRLALHGRQTTLRAEADPRLVDEGVPAMRRTTCQASGQFSGREPLRQLGGAEVIGHGREALLQVLRGCRVGVLSILNPGSTSRPPPRATDGSSCSAGRRSASTASKSASAATAAVAQVCTRSPRGRRSGESQGWQGPHPQGPQRIRQRGHQSAACLQRCAPRGTSLWCEMRCTREGPARWRSATQRHHDARHPQFVGTEEMKRGEKYERRFVFF